MTQPSHSALGGAVERTILSILADGLAEGASVERPVELTDGERALLESLMDDGCEMDPLLVTGRRDDEWSKDAFFHVSSETHRGALESFFLPPGAEVTPGVVSAVFAVPREARLSSEAGNPLAEPHDLSSPLSFWAVAAVHSR